MRTNPQASDEELVRQAQQGSRQAFELLMERHRKEIVAHCNRILHNDADSEDAAQDTLLKAWDRLGTLRVASRFETWLKRCATNTCLNIVRDRKGLVATFAFTMEDLEEQADVESLQSRNSVEETVIPKVSFADLLARIRHRVQTAGSLWDIDDWTIFHYYFEVGETEFRDIAKRVGLKEGRVKYRFHTRIKPLVQIVYEEWRQECGSL